MQIKNPLTNGRAARFGGPMLAVLVALSLPAVADTVRQQRDVSGFSEVVFSGSGDLYITQGDSEALTIEAEQKVLDVITTEVRGDVLHIGRKRGSSVRSREDIVFELSVRELTRLGMSGSGDAEAEALQSERLKVSIAGSADVAIGSLEADELRVTISGSGNLVVSELNASNVDASISGSGEVTLGGVAQAQDVAVSGSGDYLALELESAEAEVTVVGSGDVEVWATRTLAATVTGSGDVTYRGTPEVSVRVTGSGTVEAKGGEMF